MLEKLEEEFGVKGGETAKDLSVTLETVGCIGCCGLAPVITLNEEISGEVNAKKLKEVVDIVLGKTNVQLTS